MRTRRIVASVMVVVALIVLGWFLVDQWRRIDEYSLMEAASQGNVEELAKLVTQTNLNARFGGDGETALLKAASSGRLEAVRFLVERGADVNALDGEGNSALLAATYRGHREIVELLLSRGAAVNVQEKRHGFTPLIQAVSKNDKGLVRMFLRHGADVSLKTSDGRTALDRATANNSAEIVEMLKAPQTKH